MRDWLFANGGGQRTAVERVRHSAASSRACSRARMREIDRRVIGFF